MGAQQSCICDRGTSHCDNDFIRTPVRKGEYPLPWSSPKLEGGPPEEEPTLEIIAAPTTTVDMTQTEAPNVGEEPQPGENTPTIKEKDSSHSPLNIAYDPNLTETSAIVQSILQRSRSSRFQNLEFVSELGKGAFGTASLVRSKLEPDHEFVFKVVPCSQENLNSVLEEAKVLMKVRHPNIVGMVDFCIVSRGNTGMSDVGFLMEYCSKGDLSVATQHRQPFDVIRKWMLQMCRGLQAVHDADLIHRDIKLQNIFRDSDDVIKIGDFGVAHALQSTNNPHGMVGTPGYFAPEVLNGDPITNKVDIFALGCVWYALLTGGLPRLQGTSVHTAVRKLNGLCTSSDCALISRMLAVDAESRPTATEAADLIELKATSFMVTGRQISTLSSPMSYLSDNSGQCSFTQRNDDVVSPVRPTRDVFFRNVGSPAMMSPSGRLAPSPIRQQPGASTPSQLNMPRFGNK